MSEIQFGLRIPPCGVASGVGAFAGEVERAGFDSGWFPDSQFLFRDVWVTMAYAAAHTTTLTLGPAVTNFETRHLAITASAAATLDEVVPGRVRLGLGSGESAVKTLGISPTRRARMAEDVTSLRALIGGDVVMFDPHGTGPYSQREMRLHTAAKNRVPLYIGAIGPKMTRLAGAIADGVIIQSGASPTSIAENIARVQAGAVSAGRTLADIDILLGAHTAVADDELEAIRQIKPLVAQTAQQGGHGPLKAIGIEVEVPAVVEDVYPDMGHAEDWQHAVEVAGRWVTDDMARSYAERYALVGTPHDVARRMIEAVGLGVNGFMIFDVASYELPHALLTAFGEQIMPRVRAAARGAR